MTAARATALLPIDDALAIVLDAAVPLAAEDVPLADADGRFLATAMSAAIQLPPFTNSAMDGYAVRAVDTPGTLVVVGEAAAGRPYEGALAAGQAVTISTGAELPVGADAVVPVEEVDRAAMAPEGHAISVVAAAAHEQHIRHAGSDSERGAQILPAGVSLGPAQIGAAAAVGLGTVRCARRPRVAILTTGTELREPGEPLAPGQIYDANGPMLAAALARAGAVTTRIPAAADTAEAHREALVVALEHDVVISSGGVSVGPHDLVRGIGAELGVRELFWRVKMRPGKPVSFGVRDRSAGGFPAGARPAPTLVFGLPGNPVSTLVSFELFVRPALLALQGAAEPRPAFQRGTLATAVRMNAERDDLIRVRRDEHGALVPIHGQQSHQIAVTAQADGIARIPTGTGELPAGSEVSYLPLH